MSEYKGIKGFQVQTRTEDPVPYAQALADNPYAGTWSSGGDLNTARYGVGGVGIQTAALSISGYNTANVTNVESYNGSSWTEVADVSTARRFAGSGGTYTSAFLAGGHDGSPGYSGATEEYGGSSWTAGGALGTARRDLAGGGTLTAGIVFGGNEPGFSNKTEEYDGSSWTAGGTLPSAIYAHAGTGTQTAALSFGGSTTSPVVPGITGSTAEYNGSSWTSGGTMNTGRYFLSGSGTQTSALAFGGVAPGSTTGATESYDGTSWTEVNDLATARYGLGGGGPSNTVSIAFAGDVPGTGLANTEEWTFSGIQPTDPAVGYADAITGDFYYNSTTGQFKQVNTGGAPIGTWASVSSMNTARGRLGGFGTATAAIGAGGVLPPNGVTDVVESWNGTAWTEVAEINTSRNTGHFQFGTSTNGIIAGGSTTGPGVPTLTIVESWNGSAWTETGDLNKAKNGGAASGTYTAGVIFGGYFMPASPAYTILAETETWNGSAWTEVNDLNSSRYTNAAAIGGPSTATITFGRANESPDSIVESWDGTNWTEVGDLNEGRESPGGAGTQTAAMAFGGTPNAALNEIWNGSSWTEANDLGTGRSQVGNAGATNTSALAFGGASPGYTNVAEQFTAADFLIKTVTTS